MRNKKRIVQVPLRIFVAATLLSMNLTAAAPAAEKHADPDDSPVSSNVYTIGPGDVLDISVWKESALTKKVIVTPDGNISFPLVGEIRAIGLTVNQVKKTLESRIKRYVPHPNLSVAVVSVNSLHIYVIGKVNNPGRYELNTYLNVLQALAMAGGLNSFAKKNKIKIFRETDQGTRIFDFKYGDVTDGKSYDQNIRLVRGDIIVVP
jgi:polysaccharide export outer membrane protein